MTHEEQLREALRELRKWWGEPVCKAMQAGQERHEVYSGEEDERMPAICCCGEADLLALADAALSGKREGAAEVGAEARVLANLREYVLHMFTEESLTAGSLRLTFAGHVWRIIAPPLPRRRTGSRRAPMSERLTPEDFAQQVPSDNRTYLKIAAAIRSALAQRDQEWREAVRASGLMLSPDGDNPAWSPLRALMKGEKHV